MGPWCLPAPDGCPLSVCKLKASGPIEVIPNSSGCNIIHKCADLRTYISRFAEPAPTWIPLLPANIVRTQGIAHWDVWQRTCCFTPPHHSSTSRACTQFRGYLKNQRQTKTLPPPSPPPIQRGGGEKRGDKKRNEERKSTSKKGGGHLNTGLDKAVKKRDSEERRWMKREWISQRRSHKTWIECMCLLSQLITLYRGHGLTLHTTHTRSSGMGWDVSSNCNSFESLNKSHSPLRPESAGVI